MNALESSPPVRHGGIACGLGTDLSRALALASALLLGLFSVAITVQPQLTAVSVEVGFSVLLGLLFVFTAFSARAARGVSGALPSEQLCLALCLWFGVTLLGLLRTQHAGEGVPLAMNFFLFGLLLLGAYAFISVQPAARVVLARAIVAMGAVEALYGLSMLKIQLPRLREQIAADTLPLRDNMTSLLAQERIHSEEIYGSFEIANSYAAFLLVTIFVQLGLWLDERRKRPSTVDGASPSAVTGADVLYVGVLFLQLAALRQSGSKGAWVAALLGAWFFVAQALARNARRTKILAALTALGIAALVAVLALLTTGVIEASLLGESFSMRIEYWRTAWRMVAVEPVLGLGLGSFGDAFACFKTSLATETRQAHNDWLQLWAELGVLGPLAWGLLWWTALRPAPTQQMEHRPQTDPYPDARKLKFAVLAGGLAAFVIVYTVFGGLGSGDLWDALSGQGDAYTPFGALIALLLPVLFAVVSFFPQDSEEAKSTSSSTRLAWGIRAAVGAVLVHQLVDFDLRAPAVMAALFLLAGLLPAQQATSATPTQRVLPRLFFWTAAALALAQLPAAIVLHVVSGQARDAASVHEEEGLESTRRMAAAATNTERERMRAASIEALKNMTREREHAFSATPYDGQAAFDLALGYLTLRQHGLRNWSATGGISNERDLGSLARERLTDALRLRPYWSVARSMAGHHELNQGRELLMQQEVENAALHFEAAAGHYWEGARLYPHAPAFAMLAGDALLLRNLPKAAAHAYAQGWTADAQIYDPNQRFAAIFHDARPGCLATMRHGRDLEVAALLVGAIDPDAPGVLARRMLLAARERLELRATQAPAEALRAANAALLKTCQDLAQAAPDEAHATLFLAVALSTSTHDAVAREAWAKAHALIEQARTAGRPTPLPKVVEELRRYLGVP